MNFSKSLSYMNFDIDYPSFPKFVKGKKLVTLCMK